MIEKARKLKYIVWLLLWGPAFIAAGGGDTATFTLGDLEKKLQGENLLLKMAELDKAIAKQEYRRARALPNPSLELSRGKGELPGSPEEPELWGVGVELSLPNPIYRAYLMKSLGRERASKIVEAEIKKKELVKRFKHHFFRLQYYQKEELLQQEKIKILSEMNRIIKARVNIGESKEIDSLRASVELQKSKSGLFRIQKLLATGKGRMNEFLNHSLPADFRVEEDFRFEAKPGLEEKWHVLIGESPLVKLKSHEADQKGAALQARRYSLIEGIDLFGERAQEPDAKIWRLGVGISLPLFNTGASGRKMAKYEKEKADLALEHARSHLSADLDRLVSEIRVLEKEIETFSEAVMAEGKKNLELSELLYKEGEIPLVVFLDAVKSNYALELRYFEAITEWKILNAELEALLGE